MKDYTSLRLLVSSDMPEVMAIERESFEFAWSEEDFAEAMGERHHPAVGMVAERNGRVLGFMLYELWKDALHLLSFAVSRHARRTGVGTAMIQRLKEKLVHQRRTCLVLEIRESNLAAQLFFRSHGLKAVDVIRGHYDDTEEDAYQMMYVLPELCDESPSRAGRLPVDTRDS